MTTNDLFAFKEFVAFRPAHTHTLFAGNVRPAGAECNYENAPRVAQIWPQLRVVRLSDATAARPIS